MENFQKFQKNPQKNTVFKKPKNWVPLFSPIILRFLKNGKKIGRNFRNFWDFSEFFKNFQNKRWLHKKFPKKFSKKITVFSVFFAFCMVNNLDLASIFWAIFDPFFRFFGFLKIFRTKTGFTKKYFFGIFEKSWFFRYFSHFAW